MRKVKIVMGLFVLGVGTLVAMDFWPIRANSHKGLR
jgi:hypothetical protein